ncbi:hypothetical protein B0H16DRAFT_1765258 [Mycena metata]|uniref:Uncharacterized protein n=1 Tax=Mycena metata TaxID=1033252 RepID=A0AAD7I6T2_9AGAR|nr:hypothetical protein B0H16DRAFT_1765258 [Mycena metata]
MGERFESARWHATPLRVDEPLRTGLDPLPTMGNRPCRPGLKLGHENLGENQVQLSLIVVADLPQGKPPIPFRTRRFGRRTCRDRDAAVLWRFLAIMRDLRRTRRPLSRPSSNNTNQHHPTRTRLKGSRSMDALVYREGAREGAAPVAHEDFSSFTPSNAAPFNSVDSMGTGGTREDALISLIARLTQALSDRFPDQSESSTMPEFLALCVRRGMRIWIGGEFYAGAWRGGVDAPTCRRFVGVRGSQYAASEEGALVRTGVSVARGLCTRYVGVDTAGRGAEFGAFRVWFLVVCTQPPALLETPTRRARPSSPQKLLSIPLPRSLPATFLFILLYSRSYFLVLTLLFAAAPPSPQPPTRSSRVDPHDGGSANLCRVQGVVILEVEWSASGRREALRRWRMRLLGVRAPFSPQKKKPYQGRLLRFVKAGAGYGLRSGGRFYLIVTGFLGLWAGLGSGMGRRGELGMRWWRGVKWRASSYEGNV